jgi:uncharacterized protein (TIGR03067 family)
MPRRLFLALVVLPLLAAGGPGADPKEEDAAARDLAKLQGKWKLVEFDLNGEVTKCAEGHVIGFEKDVEIDYDGDGGVAGKSSVKLDPSKSPRAIDLTITFLAIFPNEKGRTLHGIYQVEGDELKLAFTSAPFWGRPREFTTRKQLVTTFEVDTYKRVKP